MIPGWKSDPNSIIDQGNNIVGGCQTCLDQTESVVEGWQDVLVTGNNHIWSGSGSSQSGESDENNDGHAGTAEP